MLTQRREEKSTPACRGEREREGERERARARASQPERALWLHCLYVFLSLGLSCVNWASQECCLFYLRSSFPSSDLPLFYFSRAFLFLIFQPLPFWTPFPYSNYLTRSHHLEKTIFNFSRTIDCI